MASINPYAEEKEHFLFAYDAPMVFQIHFCLTIKKKKRHKHGTFITCLNLARNVRPICAVQPISWKVMLGCWVECLSSSKSWLIWET